MAAVTSTSIADEYGLLLHSVPALAMGCARIDGVFVVEAPANRVTFDDLIAHIGGNRKEQIMRSRRVR
jgi:hypothetical protein